MTRSQAKRIQAKLARIRTLAEEASDIFGDDPMQGELWTALNNITSACDWSQEPLNRVLAQGGAA